MTDTPEILSLSVEDKGDIKAFIAAGSFNACTCEEIKSILGETIQLGCASCIVVDLRGVNYVDSIALGVLIGALKKASEKETDFSLIMNQKIRRVFEITGLDQVFPIYKSWEEYYSESTGVAKNPETKVQSFNPGSADTVHLVSLNGSSVIDVTNIAVLKSKIQEILNHFAFGRIMAIDLSGITYVDTNFFRMLESSLKRIRPHQGKIVLSVASEDVYRGLRHAQLHLVFEILPKSLFEAKYTNNLANPPVAITNIELPFPP
jgi:anti-sigma B factor antagonist